jgi:hypothetical protein
MAHADLEQLLNVVLEFAHKMLNEHGEFFPFGSSMDLNSKITMDGAATGEDRPPSQELVDLLSRAYAQRAAAGELRAAAICADVRVVPPGKVDKTDAISVGLEHQSGEAVNVFQPYQKGWFGRIRHGKVFASARSAQFFLHSDTTD